MKISKLNQGWCLTDFDAQALLSAEIDINIYLIVSDNFLILYEQSLKIWISCPIQ